MAIGLDASRVRRRGSRGAEAGRPTVREVCLLGMSHRAKDEAWGWVRVKDVLSDFVMGILWAGRKTLKIRKPHSAVTMAHVQRMNSTLFMRHAFAAARSAPKTPRRG